MSSGTGPSTTFNSASWLELYGRIAQRYDFQIAMFARLAGGLESFYRRCGELLQLRPGMRLLDVCCGTGNLPIALASAVAPGGEICGIDFCPEMIDVAEGKVSKTPQVTFQVKDATSTGFAPESFDAVSVIAALHEMPRAMRLTVLQEANRVLKPGGRLLVGEHARSSNFLARRFNEAVFRVISRPDERITLRDMLDRGVQYEIAESGFRLEGQTVMALGGFELIVARKPQPAVL